MFNLFDYAISGNVKFQDVFSDKKKLNANLETIEKELKKEKEAIKNQIKGGKK
jgi:hypothetical protein